MAYATVAEVEAGFRTLTTDEQSVCTALLDESAVIIDDYNSAATADNKKLVSCRMVRRAIGSTSSAESFPLGATQGTVAALGYSQSWTMSNGSTGELYLSRTEKKMLGADKIGSYSPIEELIE